ncbi:MAG: hypothetical protein WCK00_01985 [Deltaproteobacteria bacterium]
MGQAFFSAQLIRRFNPRSVMSVALCSQDDSELRPLFGQYPSMKVGICSLSKMTTLGSYFLSALKEHGFHIIIASHRMKETKQPTERWLAQHGLPYDELHLK